MGTIIYRQEAEVQIKGEPLPGVVSCTTRILSGSEAKAHLQSALAEGPQGPVSQDPESHFSSLSTSTKTNILQAAGAAHKQWEPEGSSNQRV